MTVLRLIFRPEGVEPEKADFRVMRAPTEPSKAIIGFDNWDQLTHYLVTREWDDHPWVQDGDRIIDPDTVRGYLPD